MASSIESGSQKEQPHHPELSKLLRPIDKRDKGWMTTLGCRWPNEGHEKEWLVSLNRFVVIGSEQQSTRPDNPATAYHARNSFLKLLPLAYTARLKLNKMRGWALIPTDGFIGTQRLLYNKGLDIKEILLRQPDIIIIRPEKAMERLDNFNRYGFSIKKLIENSHYSILSQSSRAISQRLHAAYAIARVWGWDTTTDREHMNDLIKAEPSFFGRHVGKIRTLGRISIALFERHKPEDIPIQIFRQFLIQTIETQVAAYLKKGKSIRTPEGLTYQARKLEGYTSNELRGFILYHARTYIDDKGYPTDPVVKTYLKNFPITNEEAELLPQLTELPVRPRHARNPQRNFELRRYDTALIPADKDMDAQKVYIQALREFQPASTKQHHEWLDAIAAGLKIEASPLDPLLYAEYKKTIVNEGRKARKKLHVSLAAKVLDMRHPGSGKLVFEGENAEQNGMLLLMMGIILLAERKKDKRPEDIWQFLDENIRKNIKNIQEILTPEDTNVSDSSEDHQNGHIYP